MKWVKDIFKQTCQQNVDIHACSVTEHAFLLSICPSSFNAFKGYKVSMFSDLSWFQRTPQWTLPTDVHGNQLKQYIIFIIAYVSRTTSWNNKLLY